jgi:uncharacterized protein (TIGR02145 family)
MRFLLNLILISFVTPLVFGQENLFADPRDNQQYRFTEIHGLKWMLDDLNYFTDLSFDLPKAINDTLRVSVPPARWYHLSEINDVCPQGWRLPTGDEWLAYVKSRLAERDMRYSEGTYKSDYAIWARRNEDIQLYEEGNPLNLQVMGIFQGDEFVQAPGSADYWIQDIPMKSEVETDTIKAVKRTFPNRSHVHLYPNRTNFHSHMHHLEETNPAEMRRFLVRCVCEE